MTGRQNAISQSEAHFVSKECWTGLVSAFQSLWAAINFSVRGLKCTPSVKMRIADLSHSLAVLWLDHRAASFPAVSYVSNHLQNPIRTEREPFSWVNKSALSRCTNELPTVY